jgi:hypothetical protein
MSVVYEPRTFIHDGTYPPIGDPEHDHNDDPSGRYPSPEVPELGPYNPPPPMMSDDRGLLGDERALMQDDSVSVVADVARLDLPAPPISLPPTLSDPVAPMLDDTEPSTPATRIKPIPKPDREVTKANDGKFYCTFHGCTEEVRVFTRKCEWK